MKYAVTVFIFLISFLSIAQENSKVDSLQQEINQLNQRILELKSEIQSEILENGYFLVASKKYSYSRLELKEDKYGKVLDTIEEGASIKVLDKEIGLFKIEYNGVNGYIDSSDLMVDNNTPLEHLGYASSRTSTSPNSYKSTIRKKSLDYSKPIHVKGHYKTSKSGKRVYVRPHTRKRKGT